MTKKELLERVEELERLLEETESELELEDMRKDIKKAVKTTAMIVEEFMASGLSKEDAVRLTELIMKGSFNL